MSLAEDDCFLASLIEYKILFVTLRHRELCGFAICHHLSGDNTGRKISSTYSMMWKSLISTALEKLTHMNKEIYTKVFEDISVYNGNNVNNLNVHQCGNHDTKAQ